MAVVATSCLGRGSIATAGYSSQIKAPPANTIILKSAVVQNVGTAVTTVQFVMVTADNATQITFAEASLAQGERLLVEGWFVLNTGDYMTIYQSAGPVSYWVSGTVLQGDSPYTPPPPVTHADPPWIVV